MTPLPPRKRKAALHIALDFYWTRKRVIEMLYCLSCGLGPTAIAEKLGTRRIVVYNKLLREHFPSTTDCSQCHRPGASLDDGLCNACRVAPQFLAQRTARAHPWKPYWDEILDIKLATARTFRAYSAAIGFMA